MMAYWRSSTSSVQNNHVNFQSASEVIEPLLYKAARNILNRNNSDKLRREYEVFCERPDVKLWLKDAALFDVIEKNPQSYVGLTGGTGLLVYVIERKVSYCKSVKNIHISWMNSVLFNSFGTDNGFRLKKYANSKGISIIGDIPIYVGTLSRRLGTSTFISTGP